MAPLRHAHSDCLPGAFLQEAGLASRMPLQGSVVQRLQRYGTYGHLKQVVLSIIANEIAQQEAKSESVVEQLRRATPPLTRRSHVIERR